MSFSLDDVRKQLGELGYHDVPDDMLQRFVMRVRSQQKEQLHQQQQQQQQQQSYSLPVPTLSLPAATSPSLSLSQSSHASYDDSPSSSSERWNAPAFSPIAEESEHDLDRSVSSAISSIASPSPASLRTRSSTTSSSSMAPANHPSGSGVTPPSMISSSSVSSSRHSSAWTPSASDVSDNDSDTREIKRRPHGVAAGNGPIISQSRPTIFSAISKENVPSTNSRKPAVPLATNGKASRVRAAIIDDVDESSHVISSSNVTRRGVSSRVSRPSTIAGGRAQSRNARTIALPTSPGSPLSHSDDDDHDDIDDLIAARPRFGTTASAAVPPLSARAFAHATAPQKVSTRSNISSTRSSVAPVAVVKQYRKKADPVSRFHSFRSQWRGDSFLTRMDSAARLHNSARIV